MLTSSLTFRFIIIRVLLILIFSFIGATNLFAEGKIAGQLVDSETGEPLIGANVYLENSSYGAASDLEGYYIIQTVPSGEYTLVVLNVGYAETKITGVKVIDDELTKVDLAVASEIMTSETIIVEAKVLENTDASLLKSRQKSNAISDAVSSETISRVKYDLNL